MHRPPPESAKREQIKQQVASYVRISGDKESPEPVVEFITDTYDDEFITTSFEKFENDLRNEDDVEDEKLDEMKDQLDI